MKKIVFLAVLCSVLMIFASCSGGANQKAEISVNVPKEVLQEVAMEAAREGQTGNQKTCDILCLLYVDGWAEAFGEWDWYDEDGSVKYPGDNHFIIEKSIPYNDISDLEAVKFSYPEIYVGAEVQAQVIIVCDKTSYSGFSEEVELTEEGAALKVTLEKDFRRVILGGNNVQPMQEIEILAPVDSVDNNGNECWEFSVPEDVEDYVFSWFFDGELQNGSKNTLSLYKALLPKGEHLISCKGTSGNKTCSGQLTVDINKRQNVEAEDRIIFISTDRGLEFRVNRFDGDVFFKDLYIREKSSDIQVNCDVPWIDASGCYGWTGCWPFVEPGKTYYFSVNGNWGTENSPDSGDYKKSKAISVKYTGTTNTPIAQQDWEYMKIINNYAHNKQYSAKEVNINKGSTEAPDIHYLITFEQTEKNEIFDLFKASGQQASKIICNINFISYQPGNENWWIGRSYDMYNTGERRPILKDYDLINFFDEGEKGQVMEKWTENHVADYPLAIDMSFDFKLQGMNNQKMGLLGYDILDFKKVNIPHYTDTASN